MKHSFKFLKIIINWFFILIILKPWIIIILRYNIVGQNIKKFEVFITLSSATEEMETQKKWLFY